MSGIASNKRHLPPDEVDSVAMAASPQAHAVADADGEAAAPLSSGKSMKLRSGRKKRLRNDEQPSSAAANDSEPEPKKPRPSREDDEDDEDDYEAGPDSEDEDHYQEFHVSSAVAASSPEPATKPTLLHKNGGSRAGEALGGVTASYESHEVTMLSMTAAAAPNGSRLSSSWKKPMEDDVTRTAARVAKLALKSSAPPRAVATAPPVLPPAAPRVAVISPALRFVARRLVRPLLTSSWGWMLMWGLLQVVFYPIVYHPILTLTLQTLPWFLVTTSRRLLGLPVFPYISDDSTDLHPALDPARYPLLDHEWSVEQLDEILAASGIAEYQALTVDVWEDMVALPLEDDQETDDSVEAQIAAEERKLAQQEADKTQKEEADVQAWTVAWQTLVDHDARLERELDLLRRARVQTQALLTWPPAVQQARQLLHDEALLLRNELHDLQQWRIQAQAVASAKTLPSATVSSTVNWTALVQLLQAPLSTKAWQESVRNELKHNEAYLLDSSNLSLLRNNSNATCGGANAKNWSGFEYLTKKLQVHEANVQLLLDAVFGDTAFQSRISQWLAGRAHAWATPRNATAAQSTNSTGSSAVAIQAMIQSRLEMEWADQLGAIDYATIRQGARIVRHGPFGTSKSFVDDLPLVNRLLAGLDLRFHGHGPEAALTPTFPSFALGQCWSFEKQAPHADLERRDAAKFATLTLTLARPIYVTQVYIEHPSADATDQVESAIRSFRLYGFASENPSAADAWRLGTFSYQKGGPSRQEFKIPNRVSGKDVPPLRSISLLVDSNWGAPYSCLYRLRVHGKES
jgi:Sad1 / UNC-like C-terminal